MTMYRGDAPLIVLRLDVIIILQTKNRSILRSISDVRQVSEIYDSTSGSRPCIFTGSKWLYFASDPAPLPIPRFSSFSRCMSLEKCEIHREGVRIETMYIHENHGKEHHRRAHRLKDIERTRSLLSRRCLNTSPGLTCMAKYAKATPRFTVWMPGGS